MSKASEAKRCEICGNLIPKRVTGLCATCLDLRDLMLPLMHNETARAFLLSQFLSKDDADAILDMHALTASSGCGLQITPRRKAWNRLVVLSRKLTERKTR